MSEKYYSKEASPYQDFKKVFCAYHNSEFLTNFCVDKSCLMPLCPSCIVEHTEQHYRDHSKPLYMNIHEALHGARESCYQSVVELEEYSSLVNQMKKHRTSIIEELSIQLNEHKNQVHQQIDEMFAEYEKQVCRTIFAQEEEEGLFDPLIISRHEEEIHNGITELYERIGMLKGDQCLAAIIMFYGQGREELERAKQSLKQFVARHDAQRIVTKLNQPIVLSKLDNLFQDAVQIQKITVSDQPLNLKSPSRYKSTQIFTPQRSRAHVRGSNTSGNKSRIFEDASYSPTQSQRLAASNQRSSRFQSRRFEA